MTRLAQLLLLNFTDTIGGLRWPMESGFFPERQAHPKSESFFGLKTGMNDSYHTASGDAMTSCTLISLSHADSTRTTNQSARDQVSQRSRRQHCRSVAGSSIGMMPPNAGAATRPRQRSFMSACPFGISTQIAERTVPMPFGSSSNTSQQATRRAAREVS